MIYYNLYESTQIGFNVCRTLKSNCALSRRYFCMLAKTAQIFDKGPQFFKMKSLLEQREENMK